MTDDAVEAVIVKTILDTSAIKASTSSSSHVPVGTFDRGLPRRLGTPVFYRGMRAVAADCGSHGGIFFRNQGRFGALLAKSREMKSNAASFTSFDVRNVRRP